jgi:hypothetical protein
MSLSSNRPLSRDRAWSCVSLNFSISGLGTLKAGRIFAGTGQMLFNFAGLFLFGTWLFGWGRRIFQAQMGETVLSNPAGWLWKWAVVFFAISWSWMLITCISLMRQAKSDEAKNSQNVPPRLADLPRNDSDNQ